MMYWLALLLGGLAIVLLNSKKKSKSNPYLEELNQTILVSSMDADKQAVNLNSLTEETLAEKLRRYGRTTRRQLGVMPEIKALAFIVVLMLAGFYIDQNFVRGNQWAVIALTEVVGIALGLNWLQKRERTQFEDSFPDALNMLASAVSAGESIMHAISFVGKNLEGEVGREFKVMGERLQLGESPDSVFAKSCNRFPYPSFYFFVITLRANMQRGGQLKDIIMRLNRLMFDARAIEKKKYALTSEARTSAKIVAAIPFIFILMLKYMNPENYEFVMFEPDGRPILYYVLISEFIGIAVVWWLMKGVK
ncbi:type II secretion system F family protein [Vibrio nigripulchritudo]|uniref:type II secretion system F family protein n=1 Tax=Vibrio nigripulchritudo TaxID=28173 RepID=UPI002492FF2C|nr:type II secretion system F family protein [Vibrio nigripulchritudo]BDU39727.1 TadB involved in pilus formation and/or protein secretion [Vibrio nigripulchritudo]BDU45450.1 TadB involved in pilus formation and/or protein secretion [Vibrio nigripulchritudo]